MEVSSSVVGYGLMVRHTGDQDRVDRKTLNLAINSEFDVMDFAGAWRGKLRWSAYASSLSVGNTLSEAAYLFNLFHGGVPLVYFLFRLLVRRFPIQPILGSLGKGCRKHLVLRGCQNLCRFFKGVQVAGLASKRGEKILIIKLSLTCRTQLSECSGRFRTSNQSSPEAANSLSAPASLRSLSSFRFLRGTLFSARAAFSSSEIFRLADESRAEMNWPRF
jgi:hypothetical protein